MSGDELRAGERLLRLEDLIKDEHLQEIPSWWAGLPIIGRARGRWVFVEPKGLDYPRQRVRRELLDVPSLDDLDIPDDEQNLERHNKTSWRPIKGENLHNWKSFALKSTNQVFQKVPDPDPYFNGIGVWLKMFRKSHGGLLRSGAMELIMAWQAGTTDRQRSAVSELLWTFTDHLTSRRGKTTTVQHYGPKQGDKAHINLIDPFSSSLGARSLCHTISLPRNVRVYVCVCVYYACVNAPPPHNARPAPQVDRRRRPAPTPCSASLSGRSASRSRR